MVRFEHRGMEVRGGGAGGAQHHGRPSGGAPHPDGDERRRALVEHHVEPDPVIARERERERRRPRSRARRRHRSRRLARTRRPASGRTRSWRRESWHDRPDAARPRPRLLADTAPSGTPSVAMLDARAVGCGPRPRPPHRRRLPSDGTRARRAGRRGHLRRVLPRRRGWACSSRSIDPISCGVWSSSAGPPASPTTASAPRAVDADDALARATSSSGAPSRSHRLARAADVPHGPRATRVEVTTRAAATTPDRLAHQTARARPGFDEPVVGSARDAGDPRDRDRRP